MLSSAALCTRRSFLFIRGDRVRGFENPEANAWPARSLAGLEAVHPFTGVDAIENHGVHALEGSQMKTLVVILQLIPSIIAAVKAAKQFVPICGQGKAKLDFVLGVIDDVYEDSVAIRAADRQSRQPDGGARQLCRGGVRGHAARPLKQQGGRPWTQRS